MLVIRVEDERGPVRCRAHDGPGRLQMLQIVEPRWTGWRGCAECLTEDFGPLELDASRVADYRTGDIRQRDSQP